MDTDHHRQSNNDIDDIAVTMMRDNNVSNNTTTVDMESQQQHQQQQRSPSISPSKKVDLSFCILWCPLPLITWIVPFVGHLGIADSHGVSHDFEGPYSIGKNSNAVMAFGPTTRYLKVDIGNLSSVDRWDDAIQEADRIYCHRMHNICCDNCHSHVAKALNLVRLLVCFWLRVVAMLSCLVLRLCFLDRVLYFCFPPPLIHKIYCVFVCYDNRCHTVMENGTWSSYVS
jgi:hypothetical protein